MDYTFLPTLQHMAKVKIAIHLWTHPPIKRIWAQYDWSQKNIWEYLEKRVDDNLGRIKMAEILRNEVRIILKPVGRQIKELFRHPDRRWSDLLGHGEWTSHGTIDVTKLAAMLVENDNVYIVYRFKVACAYCFEEKIHKLWNKLSEQQQEMLGECVADSYANFWIRYVQGDFGTFDEPKYTMLPDDIDLTECAVEVAERNHYLMAMKFFYYRLPLRRKLNPARLRDFTHSVANCRRYEWLQQESPNKLLCYLLSRMTETEQMDVFKRSAYQILSCFLEWPFHDFLLATANRVWPFLEETQFRWLLIDLLFAMAGDYIRYSKILKDFYCAAPLHFKKYIRQHHEDLVVALLDVGAL